MFQSLRRWQDYLDATGHSPRTSTEYRRALIRFLADVMMSPEEVAEDDVVGYLASLGPKGGAKGLALRALRSYYGWASGRSETPNPTVRLKVRKPKVPPAPYLTTEEVARVVEAAAEREPRRAWAIILAYSTGARLASLCSLTPDDVQDGKLHFRVAKGGRTYSVPLSGIAAQSVAELTRLGHPTLLGVGPTMFWTWLNQASRDAGVRAWPHLLRHSFATRLRQTGTDAVMLAQMLGHSDLSQVHRYAGVEESEKRDAVARAFG